MRAKLRSALDLTPWDWWLIFQAWCMLLVVDLGLRWYSFRRLQAWLERRQRKLARQVDAAQANAVIRQTRRAMAIARRNHLYDVTCLPHALALQWLLARQEVRTELKLGVNRESGELKAHAWLEFEGAPIGEPETITEQFGLLMPVG